MIRVAVISLNDAKAILDDLDEHGLTNTRHFVHLQNAIEKSPLVEQ